MCDDERKIYEVIKEHKGILSKDISLITDIDKRSVSSLLHHSIILRSLCYMDENWFHHAYESVSSTNLQLKHSDIEQYSCYYSAISDFVTLDIDDWITSIKGGCARAKKGGIGASQIKAWCDSFRILKEAFNNINFTDSWEIAFEYNSTFEGINRWVDVLLIVNEKIVAVEFKGVRCFFEKYLGQTEKYIPDLERYFDEFDNEIIPLLVLTQAVNLRESHKYSYKEYNLEVCSGDMLVDVLKSILLK